MILAHDYEDAAERPTLTLEEALDHLASAAYAQLEFIVDLKLPGYEGRVVEALERSGLADRAIVSTTYRESLLALKAITRACEWAGRCRRRGATTPARRSWPCPLSRCCA